MMRFMWKKLLIMLLKKWKNIYICTIKNSCYGSISNMVNCRNRIGHS